MIVHNGHIWALRGLSTFRAMGMRLNGTDDTICIAVSTSGFTLYEQFADQTTRLLIVQ